MKSCGGNSAGILREQFGPAKYRPTTFVDEEAHLMEGLIELEGTLDNTSKCVKLVDRLCEDFGALFVRIFVTQKNRRESSGGME